MYEPTLLQLSIDIGWFFLTVLAVDNLVDMLTMLDALEWIRAWAERWLGPLKKIVRCFLCQSFWLSLILSALLFLGMMPLWLKWAILWFAMHRIIQHVNEFGQRFLGRAPFNVFVTQQKNDKDQM